MGSSGSDIGVGWDADNFMIHHDIMVGHDDQSAVDVRSLFLRSKLRLSGRTASATGCQHFLFVEHIIVHTAFQSCQGLTLY